MKNYALDTNIISYLLKKNQKIKNRVDEERQKRNKIIIPPMVYFETRRGLMYLKAAKKLASFEKLYQTNGIDTIEKDTLDVAINIYVQLKNHKPTSITIDDGDLLIAAYCLQNDCILASTNTKHFEYIENLQIENWLE